MAKKSLSREAKNHKDEKGSLSTAKKPVVKVPEKAPEKVKTAEVVQEKVIQPVEKAVKTKKPRFIRGKKEKTPPVTIAPLPPRSKKAAAKMMSKNVVLPPKAEPNLGSKPKP